MNTFPTLAEARQLQQAPLSTSGSAFVRKAAPIEAPSRTKKMKHPPSKKNSPKKEPTVRDGDGPKQTVGGDNSRVGKATATRIAFPQNHNETNKKNRPTMPKKSPEDNSDTNKTNRTKKKSSAKARGDADNSNKEKEKKLKKPQKSCGSKKSEAMVLPSVDETIEGTSVQDIRKSSLKAECGRDGFLQHRMPRRVSFGNSDSYYEDPIAPTSPLTNRSACSIRSLSSRTEDSPLRRSSFLATSIRSFLSRGSEQHRLRPTNRRRTAFANSRSKQQNQQFRISKNPTKMKAERIEAFFYNHGMEIALGVLYLALNILAAAHGAYQFTEIGGFKTEDDILRVTLPIARAGGRLVTLNCAVLLLTGCKYLWTCIRTYVAPIIPIGFPIDNIMPKYHRYVALTIIVSGCIVHTLPQIVNYATKSITMDHDGMKFWTFGDGFASKQLLLTGSYLTVIFTTFFVTTLKSFRKTAAGFRWFWFFHMGGIATAYPLLLIHGTCRGHPIFLYFAIAPLLLYLFDIAMRRSNVSTTDIVEWITHDDEGQQITELIVRCPRNFAYTPGQYVELKYPQISKREWHPFTIASAPIEKDKINDQTNLVFYIKNSGRWTEALYNCATNAFDATKNTQNPMQIQIRGPHGGPAMNYFEYKHIVVIGSGVGVTPLLSIWKYLVARGRTMVYNPDKSAKGSGFTLFGEGSSLQENLDESHKSMKKFDADSRTRISTFCSTCIFLEKVFESMTVSMSLLILFVLGETLAFVLQIFGFSFAANSFGSALSLIALIAHGSAVLVSTVALGWSNYFKQFKCWLECAIIIVDTFALWFSLKSCMVAHADLVGVESMTAISAYFIFFGLVVILHTILIFHIFYKALKPISHADNTNVTKSVSKLLSNSVCTKSSYSSFTNQEICSIDGILINRMYSSMKFAARVLLPPIIEEGMADLFSMEFYGTREESKDRDRSENGLIADMMGSFGRGLDIRSHMCKHQHDEYFHPGRPNWTKIFLKAMAKAHQRNPKGESVGVFFCGSPAIAKDLQVAAAEVTARHQFAVKHMDGEACKCKLIVHSENF